MTLPADLAALTTDPRFALKNGRFHEVVVDTSAEQIVITIDCGDLQVGYRRLTLVLPRSNAGPEQSSTPRGRCWRGVPTELLASGSKCHGDPEQKVAALPDGRYVLPTATLAVPPVRDRVLRVLACRGSAVNATAGPSGTVHQQKVAMRRHDFISCLAINAPRCTECLDLAADADLPSSETGRRRRCPSRFGGSTTRLRRRSRRWTAQAPLGDRRIPCLTAA